MPLLLHKSLLGLILGRYIYTDSNCSSIFTRFRDTAAFVLQHATFVYLEQQAVPDSGTACPATRR